MRFFRLARSDHAPATATAGDRYERLAPWALAAFALAALLLYWPGLAGPFLLDDGVTFPPIQRWLAGEATLAEAVLGRGSPLAARPVAMGSFALNAWLGGYSPYSFKLGNLLLHLLCGALVWQVLRRLLALDARLQAHARWLAALAAGLWLLHPIQVSTVLYSVQRMAQLGALLALAAVLVYLLGRAELAAGRVRPALSKLFVTFPLLVALGLLSKQNAAVAPLLCLVVEWTYFRREGAAKTPVRAFFALFVALPALALLGLLIAAPATLLSGYAEWDFDLGQRLLSQARALLAYLGDILWPRGAGMGLYTDDFAASTGLLAPASTLWSLLALAAITAAALALRRRAPSVCAGWLLFLAAHAVESSFLPVELYYEHRNYLPLAGLVLAAVGLSALLPQTLRDGPGHALRAGGVALLAVAALSAVTTARVSVWRSLDAISAEGLREHPQSLRALYDRSAVLIERGDLQGNIALMQSLAASPDARRSRLGRINLIVARCRAGARIARSDYDTAVAPSAAKLTLFETQALRLLAHANTAQGCGTDGADLARRIAALADATRHQPESARPKWLLRLLAAETYARSGDLAAAETQADIAWRASGDLPAGVLLAKLLLARGAPEQALPLVQTLSLRIKPYDSQGQAELAGLYAQLTAAPR